MLSTKYTVCKGVLCLCKDANKANIIAQSSMFSFVNVVIRGDVEIHVEGGVFLVQPDGKFPTWLRKLYNI